VAFLESRLATSDAELRSRAPSSRESARNRLKIKTIGSQNCSKAQRENRAQVRGRDTAYSALAGFAFVGCGDPLMLLLHCFKAMLFGWAGKSGRPPPLEPSLKVQRDTAHNQSSGFAVAPRVKGLNGRGPLKVHPKWADRGKALAYRAMAGIARHMTGLQPDPISESRGPGDRPFW
jgi:hypothetical protein